MPISEIAEKMGRSRKVVYNLIRKKMFMEFLNYQDVQKFYRPEKEMLLLNLQEENA